MGTSNKTRSNASKKDLINLLFEKKALVCALCGRRLTPSTCIIEHKLPKPLGGNNDISNLQLVCLQCNAKKSEKPFLGYQFESYIKQIISAHPDYDLIDDIKSLGQWEIIPDVVCRHHNNQVDKLIIAEIKLASSFTEDRIQSIIFHLSAQREVRPDAHLVFITPRELPERYQELLQKSGIELWDKKYLSQEFTSQIEEQKASQFTSLFYTESTENECDVLIRELKSCPSGKDCWGKYEKLVKRILELLFCPPLNRPLVQCGDALKQNRRDYILPNYSRENDCWEFLRNKYSADYVVIDAKNSGKYIKKSDVLQIANYLKKDGTGLFGIIISRKGANTASEYAIREAWRYEGKMIVVLNDTDVEEMLLAKKNGSDPATLILKKIEDFRLSI